MQRNQPSEAELIPQFGLAFAFGFGGLCVCVPLGFALWFFCNLAGWGDGSTGNAISNPAMTAILLVLPLAIYFILGVIAAISSSKRTRKTLLVFANLIMAMISMIIGFVILESFPFAILGLILVVVIFSLCWHRLNSDEKTAKLGADCDAEEAV